MINKSLNKGDILMQKNEVEPKGKTLAVLNSTQ
jgi:hypothetical protein